jgi:hypothetical protein
MLRFNEIERMESMMSKDLTKELKRLFESEDGKLFVPKVKTSAPTGDDRLAESFQKIIDFVEENDRQPDIESKDINEAMLAKRLELIKNTPDKVKALESFDSLGLLVAPEVPKSIEELFDKDEYGLFGGAGAEVLNVTHVPLIPRAQAEEVARRTRADDFNEFKLGFISTQEDLKSGKQRLVTFTSVDQIKQGRYFVNGGLLLYVAEIGEEKLVHGRMKSRIRAIFENGSESNMFLRSLSSQLYYDGYCVVDEKELFDNVNDDENIKGYIYVVRSLSEDPKISTISDLYKIGFSRTPVAKRIASSKDDPTYLMSDLELVESYRVTGEYNPQKVEHFIHRVFADAALDVSITDKYGKNYTPREWYCVPIQAIRHAVELIDSGEITKYIYDNAAQQMREI